MGDRSQAARLLSGGAALLAFSLTAVACSSTTRTALNTASTTTVAGTVTTLASASTAPAASSSGAADPTATTVVAAASSTGPPVAADSIVGPVHGPELLQTALAALGAGYHFSTAVTVNGAVILTADGDKVGAGTRLKVVQNSAAVQYVITANGTWVMPDGGQWQQLDTAPAATDPIVALRSPSAVAVTSTAGTTVNLAVTVAASALGVSGDAPVSVALTIVNGVVNTITYATTVNSQPATVVATIGPVVDSTPVVAPI